MERIRNGLDIIHVDFARTSGFRTECLWGASHLVVQHIPICIVIACYSADFRHVKRAVSPGNSVRLDKP